MKSTKKSPAARKPVAGKKGNSTKAKKSPTTAKPSTSKPGKRQARNEFRYNNTTKHPNYVFEEDGKKFHSVGITHSEKTADKKGKVRNNMPLKQNPNKKDERSSYIRYGIITDKKTNYSNLPIKNMEFEKDDFSNIKAKVRNYKRRRQKKHKKKTND